MMTNQEQTVAQIILSQLGGNRFVAMTGARNMLDHGNGLSVQLPRTPGFTKQGINYIRVSLSPLDLYQIEFGKIRGLNYKVIETLDMVYAEDLKRIISEKTGLALSL